MTPSVRRLLLTDDEVKRAIVAPLLGAPRPAVASWSAVQVGGWALDEVDTASRIALRFRAGERSLEAWLYPSARAEGSYRRTARFALGYRGAAPDAAGHRLLDALAQLVERRERVLPEELYRRWAEREPLRAFLHEAVPAEWLAVSRGLKPACRQSVPSGRLEAVRADAERRGLVLTSLPAAAFIDNFQTAHRRSDDLLVYLARTSAQAEAAREAERAMLTGAWSDPAEARRWMTALGEALGYPPCCIDYFAPRFSAPNAALRFEALAATPGDGSFLLDNLDFGASLVSHFPCRYDCAPSIAYAQALFEELRALGPRWAPLVEDDLRGVLLFWRDGAFLRLKEREPERDRERPRGEAGAIAVRGAEAGGDREPPAPLAAAARAADSLVLDGDRLRLLREGALLAEHRLDPAELVVRPLR